MKKCRHDYLLHLGPRCIDCLIAERDQWKERAEKLAEALKMLHDETLDYITINNLGEPYHNQSMRLAKKALADFEAKEMK